MFLKLSEHLVYVISHFIYMRPELWFSWCNTTGMDDEDDGSASMNEMLDDKRRVAYFKSYLANVPEAIK